MNTNNKYGQNPLNAINSNSQVLSVNKTENQTPIAVSILNNQPKKYQYDFNYRIKMEKLADYHRDTIGSKAQLNESEKVLLTLNNLLKDINPHKTQIVYTSEPNNKSQTSNTKPIILLSTLKNDDGIINAREYRNIQEANFTALSRINKTLRPVILAEGWTNYPNTNSTTKIKLDIASKKLKARIIYTFKALSSFFADKKHDVHFDTELYKLDKSGLINTLQKYNHNADVVGAENIKTILKSQLLSYLNARLEYDYSKQNSQKNDSNQLNFLKNTLGKLMLEIEKGSSGSAAYLSKYSRDWFNDFIKKNNISPNLVQFNRNKEIALPKIKENISKDEYLSLKSSINQASTHLADERKNYLVNKLNDFSKLSRISLFITDMELIPMITKELEEHNKPVIVISTFDIQKITDSLAEQLNIQNLNINKDIETIEDKLENSQKKYLKKVVF